MTKSEFEILVLSVKENLYRLAFSILKQQDEAQDAVQEVVLRLWKNRKTLDQTKNVRSFCFSAVRNYCIDQTRKQKSADDYLKRDIQLHEEQPELEKIDLVDRIRKEVARLPEQQRIVIELKDFQGYSYPEISDMLQMPVNTVRVNVSRGRKKLFEIFKTELAYD